MENKKSYSGRFKHLYSYFVIFKHIKTYSGISRHNQAYSGIVQAYSEPFVTLAYSNPSYVQKLAYSEPEKYLELATNSEPRQTSTVERFAKIVKRYNCFRNISFSHYLVYQINNMYFFNTDPIFTPELFILCKKG